jgi:transposase-like protein
VANPGTDEHTLRRMVEAFEAHDQNISATARALGINRVTLTSRLNRAKASGVTAEQRREPQDFEVGALPDELPSAEELLVQRKKAFARKRDAKEARELIPVKVNVAGPFGVVHIGDPHVDDDGTDVGLLERHVAVINKTPALFAGNVGDASNNWIGRLARLYGEQSLSAAEAWVLVEWLIRSVRWLYIVGGNHDVWSGAGDPIKWMSHQASTLYQHHGVRLNLTTPNGRAIRINARHDFIGHSQWNTTHGPAKAAQMGWRDHILTCGHKHTSGYQVLKDPATGLLSHALRVGSYKTYDRYADAKGLPNQNFTVAPVTIIDPQFPENDPRFITVIFDPEEGAEYLTWKRKKAKVA